MIDDCEIIRITQRILDHTKTFSCGDKDLDDFFANDSIAYDKDLMGRTYCWVHPSEPTEIVGMITLANAGIQTTHMNSNPKRKINDRIAFPKRGRTYPAVLIGRLGVNKKFQNSEYHIGTQIMDFIKDWFRSDDNKTGCRFVLVDALNNEHTLRYYERNGFKPLFPRISDEKGFYGIKPEEDLRTRMYYFDLILS